jgi:pimeloyl-ACP methyl ester carboxylesterase
MTDAFNAGIRIHYEVVGDGPALVLGHGWLGSGLGWREAGYVEALRDAYQLLLIDARGHGQSDAPHGAEAYTFTPMAQDVLAVLDHHGVERAAYWGYSMGGPIGFRFGQLAPQRIHALIIGGSHPFAITPAERETFSAFLTNVQQGMAVHVAESERRWGPLPASVRARWLACDADAAAGYMAARLLEAEVGPGEPVSALTMPCLLYGSTNELSTAERRRATSLLPDATLVPLEGVNHPQGFQRADLILPHVIVFLARVMHAS